MPRRSILSSAERDGPLVMPDNPGALIRLYMFSDADLAVIRQRRGGLLHGGALRHCAFAAVTVMASGGLFA